MTDEQFAASERSFGRMLTWLSKRVFFPLWELKDGAHRARYLRDLRSTQWMSPEQLRALQWERLRSMVSYAFTNCPYHRDQYRSIGFDGHLSSCSDFQRLPLVSKTAVRTHGAQMVSEKFAHDELVEARTGGSTGTSLKVYFDRRCQEMRNAAAMRSDQWAGWDIGMKVAAIWGNPPAADTAKKKLRNLLLDRLMYLDTMDLDECKVRDFVEQWRVQKPRALFGHSHSLFILATYLQRLGVDDLKPDAIISTSMQLLEPERQVIEKVFGRAVTNRYGCEEVSLIGCECELHDGLHLNMEHVFVEFLHDDGTQASAGEEANIVVTELINHGMPLIRYCVEDMGVPSDRQCECGRGLRLMERVTGRRADFLKRLDGSLVAGVSLVERTLTAFPGIEQMQLVQDRLDEIRVRVVTDAAFDPCVESGLREELQGVFGPGSAIRIEKVERLAQTGSGKYRFAICNA